MYWILYELKTWLGLPFPYLLQQGSMWHAGDPHVALMCSGSQWLL